MSGYDYYDAPVSEESQVYAKKPLTKERSTYMTDLDAEKMCKLFADGLDAGIGYARIFDFMERQKLDQSLVDRLRYAVLELGDQLGEAFTRLGILDGVSRKVILVAEEQGELVRTFREQSRMYGERYRRRKQLAFSLVEPAIMICLAIIFRRIMGKVQEAAMSPDMWGVLTPEFITGGIESGVLMMVLGFIAYAWLNAPVDSGVRSSMGRIVFMIPVVSTPARQTSVANYCRYLGQSIRAGMDMFRSIELAAEGSNNPQILGTVDRVISAMEAGYPLEQALSVSRGLPQEVVDYVGIGEETGKLEENLDFMQKRYDELAAESFKRAMAATVYILRFLFIILIFVLAVFSGVMDFFQLGF